MAHTRRCNATRGAAAVAAPQAHDEGFQFAASPFAPTGTPPTLLGLLRLPSLPTLNDEIVWLPEFSTNSPLPVAEIAASMGPAPDVAATA